MSAPLEIYIAERRDTSGAWTVEAIDPEDGAIEQAIFIGPEAEQRAREYAAWKYRAGDPAMPRVMPASVRSRAEEPARLPDPPEPGRPVSDDPRRARAVE